MADDIDQTTVQQTQSKTVRALAGILPAFYKPMPPAPATPLAAGTPDLGALTEPDLDALDGKVSTSTGGATTAVTLPLTTQVGPDWSHTFIGLTGGANSLAVTAGAGETINGITTYTITNNHGRVSVIKREGSTDWFAEVSGVA